MFSLSLKQHLQIQKLRFINNARQVPSTMKNAGLGASALLFLLSMNYQSQIQNNVKDVEYRKEQLAKPIYVLEGDELVNPPWNKDNLQEWLYRPIQVVGRPIYYKQMMIPRMINTKQGYDQVVPLVTKEDEVAENQSGFILNRGWIPEQWAIISNRNKLEEAVLQTFVGYVSPCDELKHSFGGKGNDVTHRPELNQTVRIKKWNNVDLNVMAKYCDFQNTKQTKLAMIELVKQDSPIDEKNVKHYDMELDEKQDYPYKKTHSGALQTRYNNTDLAQKQKLSFQAGLLSTIATAALYMV